MSTNIRSTLIALAPARQLELREGDKLSQLYFGRAVAIDGVQATFRSA